MPCIRAFLITTIKKRQSNNQGVRVGVRNKRGRGVAENEKGSTFAAP